MPARYAARFTTGPTAIGAIPSLDVPSVPVNSPKYVAGSDSGGRGSLFNCSLHPGRHRDGARDKVRDDSAAGQDGLMRDTMR